VSDWREVCEREGGPVCHGDICLGPVGEACGECFNLCEGERDRLARMMELLYREERDSWSEVDCNRKFAALWEKSADA
jgi:hypothetical protein